MHLFRTKLSRTRNPRYMNVWNKLNIALPYSTSSTLGTFLGLTAGVSKLSSTAALTVGPLVSPSCKSVFSLVIGSVEVRLL